MNGMCCKRDKRRSKIKGNDEAAENRKRRWLSLALYIIVTVIIAVVIIVGFVFFKNKKNSETSGSNHTGFNVKSDGFLSMDGKYEMPLKFDDLPALTEVEEARLVEIKDEKLLARIDSAVPGTFQVVANTGEVKAYQEAAKSAGQVYQAIIPQGAVLDKSRAMEGAFRGSYREVANSIKGQANLVAVDNSAANKLAVMNVANAAMGAAAMVVGQYYMTRINDQLEDINAGIEKIADFQQNEFKSKVYALVAGIQKSSTFQLEIVENAELRNRELTHLKALEHECAQLLGQTNLSLQDITENNSVDYSKYEKLIGEAEIWYHYQQILLEVMYKISDLSYALNMGAISRESCYALYLPYAKQSEGALTKLSDWHKENAERLQISVDESRRKRQGVEGFFMGALGLIKDDFNYMKMSTRTVSLIEHQSEGGSVIKSIKATDLFQEDVRLIAKEGKLYYLPSEAK